MKQKDFVVGAPYETIETVNSEINPSTGALYIFRGGATSIKLSQKIHASQIQLSSVDTQLSTRLYGFGYSLSGGLDMDLNGYPDLAVGALNSNSILVLRTLPVVNVSASINNYDSIQDLDQKQCKYDTQIEETASCFAIDFCIEIKDYSEFISIPLLNYAVEAEPNNIYSRVYFTETNTNVFNSTASFINSNKYCTNLGLMIRKDAYDFLTPIKFLISYNFVSQNESVSRLSLNEIDKHPIVHQDNNKFEFEVKYFANVICE
jgi:hypothetical protein